MNKIIILFFAVLPFIAFSQKKEIRLLVAGGLSKHSTGDLNGYSFLDQADINLSKRFSISPGFQFTNHSLEYRLTYFKVNYVTAGLNVFTNLNFYLLNKPKHQFAIGAGPVIRFQNSSVPTEISSSLGSSGQQILNIKYDKLRTISLGYNFSPTYYYQCSKKTSVGAKFILQNDTEGDVITSYLVFFGIKL